MKKNIQLERPVTEFLTHAAATLREAMTIDEALAHLRGSRLGQVLYFYVVNDRDELVGVLPSRKLIVSAGDARIGDLMQRGVITLNATDTLFTALELFAMHRLLAIPVTDAQHKLLGIVEVSVYTDEVFDLAQHQQLNQVFQLIGLRLEQGKHGSPWRGFRLRMPWLLSNITGGLLCAALGSLFAATLEHIVLVALFIPLILALAESISVQSMTLAIEQAGRGGMSWAMLAREGMTAGLLGICTGVLAGGALLLWRERTAAALIIALSMAVTMVLAAMLGRLLPMVIHMLRLNPRVASGPVTLALVDVMTITIYLSLCTAVLM